MSDRQVIHDSRAPIKRDEIDSEYVTVTSLGIVASKLYHHGYGREVVDIEWEKPYIGTYHVSRDCVDSEYADVQVRTTLLEVADKCRALAAELIEHADRLEIRAGDEIVIEEIESAEDEDAGTELLAEPHTAAEHLTPTPALGKPVRDMLPLQLPEQETRKTVRPERSDS